MIKHYFKTGSMRAGFSMITAIFVIVIMAAVGGFIMSLSGKMVQETTTQYRKEQAILYAKSYTEYAIMAATAQKCIQSISSSVDGTPAQVINGQGYRVITKVQYIRSYTPQLCANTIGGTVISDTASKGAFILIDTYVKYRDTDTVAAFVNAGGGAVTETNLPWITYHRRTLQRL